MAAFPTQSRPLSDASADGAGLRWALCHPVWVIALLCAVLFVPGLFSRDLWNPDEPRYAEVAREMYATGAYLVPQLNGEVYAEKPPLFFWLTAMLFHLLGGPTAVAGRLVSAAAGLGVALLTYDLGRRLSGRAVGLAAAAIVATSAHFAALSQTGVIDVPLSFFVLLAIYALYRDSEAKGKLWGWPSLAWAAMAGGVLTKGPVGALLPLLACGALSWHVRRWRPAVLALVGCAMAAAIGIGWVYLADLASGSGGGFLDRMLFRQNIGRAYDTSHHRQPWHYYLVAFPPDFMPWTVLLPGALVLAVRHWREASLRTTRFYILWFVLIFAFFTAISGKRERYLMPAFPAAALLCADLFWGELGKRTRSQLWIALPAILLACLAGAAAFAACWIPLYADSVVGALKESESLGGSEFFRALTGLRFAGMLVLCVALLAVQAWCIWEVRRGRARRFFFAAVLTVVLAFLALNGFVYPAFNRAKSARPIARAYRAIERPGDRLVLFDDGFNGAYNFYLERNAIPLVKLGEPLPYPTREGQRLFLLAEQAVFLELPEQERAPFSVVAETQVGRKRTQLLMATMGPAGSPVKPPASGQPPPPPE